jgi:Kinesin motor domain
MPPHLKLPFKLWLQHGRPGVLQSGVSSSFHDHAGKTYTMEGGLRDSSDGSKLSDVAGVIPRAINQIFEHVGRIGGDLNTVKCSFLELYNEEATDLLASSKWCAHCAYTLIKQMLPLCQTRNICVDCCITSIEPVH